MGESLPTGGAPFVTAVNEPPFAVGPIGDVSRIGFLLTASGPALNVALVGAPIVVIVDLDLADDEVAIGGPDAGGTRRLGLWINNPAVNLHRQVQAPGTPQPIRSDKDAEFTDALVTNAFEDENLGGLNGNTGRIRSIVILSVQQLAWEIAFYSSDTFRSADADLDAFLEQFQFRAANGLQDAGAGLFRYAVTGLDIPIVDDEGTNELHVSIINRDAVAKIAGALGEMIVLVTVEEDA